jgi:hypothetical protein
MRALSRYRLVLILGLGLLCATLLLNEHLVPAGDNSTYIVLGQALITGQGYRMVSDPSLPEMGLYPPAYPLLLAGVLGLTGTANNLLAAILPLKLPSLLLYLGAITLAYELLKRRNERLATMTALLMAVSPPLLHFAAEVGTEIPYLVCSLACLWAFEWYRRNYSWVALLCTIVLLVLTFYIRSIALVMTVAFAVYLLAKRRFRHAAVLLLAVGLLAAPWFIRGASLTDTGTAVGLGRGYFELYFSYDPYGLEPASLSGWLERIALNARAYTLDIWPVMVFPHTASLTRLPGPLWLIVALLITSLIAAGFALEVRRKQVSEWYVAVFFASCVGYLWAQTRLVVPILPFAIYYFLVALDSSLRWLVSRFRREMATVRTVQKYAMVLICIGLTLSALRADVRRIQRNLRYGVGQPLATYYEDPEWKQYLSAMEWIDENGDPQSIVMCRKADLMYIVTGHQALEYPYSSDGLRLRASVYSHGVAYIIEDAFSWTLTTDDYLRRALQAWRGAEPAELSLVLETDAPRTRVWRVNKPN